MDEALLAVTLYTNEKVLFGFIRRFHEKRLLDILNGVFVRRPENSGKFLELIDITIHHADDRREKLPVAYINKSTIQLAAVSDSNEARGIGGKAGHKYSPFLKKSPVVVRLHTPGYVLTGSIYCARGQKIWHVLQEKSVFLPVTNARICADANGIWQAAPFVAVNREQVMLLEEGDNPAPPGIAES